jgi:DNA-binding NtrC family response regulator
MHGGAMGGEEFATERELLYKILFDMRSDINDLKRMLSDLMRGSQPVTPAPTQSEVVGLLPSSGGRDEVVDYAESEEVVEMPHRELTKADIQREQVLTALRNHNGCRRDAARELFMSERTLYRRIKDLGITDDEI